MRKDRDRIDRAAAPRRGEIEHVRDALIVEVVAVHRGEQADRAQALVERALGVLDRVLARRIEHEEADEAIRVVRDGERDRIGIARQAGDQGRRLHAMLVQLRYPARAEAVGGIGEVPAELADAPAIGAQAGKEAWREEMNVTVVDHGSSGSRRARPPSR